MRSVTLHNGISMPQLGLGVWQSGNGAELDAAIKHALSVGYRHFDTAAFYFNESGVGRAIAESGVAREEIFVTTKVWNDHQGFDKTLQAFEQSLNELRMDHVDLYLVHWPVKGKYIETWRALEELYRKGKVKAIGVSNFLQHHLEDLLPHCEVIPMVDQLEHHPYLVQKGLQAFCKEHHIQFEAWRPLMGGNMLEIPILKGLAEQYDKTPAQIILRWNIQNGIVTIPKSIDPQRIEENFDIWDLELTRSDMDAIDELDQHLRLGPDPDVFV